MEDIAALFEQRFTVAMLVNLERHIITLNDHKV